MNTPNPPYLELSFYFADMNGDNAILFVAEQLANAGARFTGEWLVQQSNEHERHPFSTVSDIQSVEISAELSAIIDRKRELRVLRAGLRDCVRIAENEPEILTQAGISRSAMSCDNHPVSIWASACSLEEYIPHEERSSAGERAYASFKDLIRVLSPSYAAATVEYTMECPYDLRQDPRTLAFADCYLSSEFISPQLLNAIRAVAGPNKVVNFANGILIASSGLFTPEFSSASPHPAPNHDEISMTVGSAIAASA